MKRVTIGMQLAFAGILFSILPVKAANDDAIIVDQHESKIKQVLKSKKFWGTIAGLGLVAGGMGALWMWYKIAVAKEIQEAAENIKNSIKESSDIRAYKVLVYQLGSKDKEYINNFKGGKIPERPYAVDTIMLQSNKGPYIIAIGLISDLENSSPAEEHEQIIKAKSAALAARIKYKYAQEGFKIDKHKLKKVE